VWQLWLRMTVMSFFTLCLVLLWLVGPGWCISQEFYIAYSRVCFCVAVVAADGGDELLHALLGAAVAGGAWLVHQRGVLLARPHAHAGVSPAAFCSACLCHDDQKTVIQMRLWVGFILFISAHILQTHVVRCGLVHAKIHATCPVGTILVPHQIQKILLPFGHRCKHIWMWWLCTPAAFGAGDMRTYQLSAFYISQRWDIQVRVNQVHLFELPRIHCQ